VRGGSEALRGSTLPLLSIARSGGSYPRARHPLFDVIDAAHTGIERAGESQEASSGEVKIVPVNRMIEGWLRQIKCQIPSGRPAMEITNLIREVAVKFNAQEVGEESVLTKPLPTGVQRHEEEILPFQELQHLLPTRRRGDDVAERSAETIQDAGLEAVSDASAAVSGSWLSDLGTAWGRHLSWPFSARTVPIPSGARASIHRLDCPAARARANWRIPEDAPWQTRPALPPTRSRLPPRRRSR
jgi:hypothetical protein